MTKNKRQGSLQRSAAAIFVLWGFLGLSAPVSTAEAKSPETNKSKKFTIPVWHSDARWELDPEPWAATGVFGNLDGPRQEMSWRRAFFPWGDYLIYDPQGLPIIFGAYDPRNERYHEVAGSARGYLDGPFSRARWAGQSYVNYSSHVLSSDGRYFVSTDPNNGGAVRVLDLKEQMVHTLLAPKAGAQAMVINSQGQVLVLLREGRLVTIDIPTRKQVADMTLKATEGLSLGVGRGLALDEERGRLYASGTVTADGKWHVWYFDLNDGGSFHGVLKGERVGASVPAYAGPFDGYRGYAEQSIRFGPDDPEKRFLYMRLTDTTTFVRLDLEKRVVAAFSGPPRGEQTPAMFIEEGVPNASGVSHAGPGWLPDGSIVLPGLRERPSIIYRRIK